MFACDPVIFSTRPPSSSKFQTWNPIIQSYNRFSSLHTMSSDKRKGKFQTVSFYVHTTPRFSELKIVIIRGKHRQGREPCLIHSLLVSPRRQQLRNLLQGTCFLLLPRIYNLEGHLIGLGIPSKWRRMIWIKVRLHIPLLCLLNLTPSFIG